MKQILLCFLAGIAGAWTCIHILPGTQNIASVQAQVTRPSDGRELIPGVSRAGTEEGASQPEPAVVPQPRAYNSDGLTPDEAAGAYVYEVYNRSVANIATRIGGQRFIWRENPTEDAGSGFVIDRLGHVMTNFHVIEDAQRILVTLYNGESHEARVVGHDFVNDIAVLKIDAPAKDLFPVRFADSSKLKVGMKVFAIGNPFGLERTMTTGIISSLNRTLPVTRARSIKSVIQIDAAINPGNSGGPLLDSHGRLIGMNTAIASRTGQSSGIGFAIPSNLLARSIPELLRHGKVIRPDIGISQVLQTEEGLRILSMDPDGPAARAGLRGPARRTRRSGFVTFEWHDRNAADLIVGVNGRKTLKVDEFLSEIESHRPGDTVSVMIIREGRPMTVDVTLGE